VGHAAAAAAPQRLARALWRIVLGLVLLSGTAWAQPAAVRIVDLARSAEDRTPPREQAFPTDTPARVLRLPDAWAHSRPQSQGPVWYAVDFTVDDPQPGTLLAVQLAQACASFELHLNGHLIHRSGRMDAPDSLDCNRPHLVSLPPALLHAGTNRLEIELAGYPLAHVGTRRRAASLSTLAIGPLDALQARQRLQTTLQLRLPQALGATLLLTGGFMFVLGFRNRRESHLAYFGALSVGWGLLDAPLWVQQWPLPHAAVELLLAALLPLVAWAAVQFLLRYAHTRLRAADLALPVQAAVMPLTLLAAGESRLYPLVTAWSVLLAIEVAAAALLYLQRQWRARSPSFWLMGALLAVVAASGCIELAGAFAIIPPLPAALARVALPLMLVLVGLRLVHQHGLARQQAEVSRTQLEQRVREATAEIEHNFRQLAELKVEQVTERERKRIAADLHDDLGAKLLTIVHTSESDRISTLAREALEEMRLSVRGLTGRAVRLADALGDWRAEVVSRLAQAGIETDWSAPEDLPQTLSARAYVQTTRILREATSNIIKHSGASFCVVQCRVSDGDFQLVVQDNGEGITQESEGRLDRGHGMATMKQRAKQLQGQCLIESGPGFGTVIRLTLPLERALHSP